MDYIINGNAEGTVAQKLLNSNFDYRQFRPYIAEDGKGYVATTLNGKATAVPAKNALLRYDEWKAFDDAVLKVARNRLRLVSDLRAAGLTYTIPNGMGKTVFVTEDMNDPGSAVISMDGLRRGSNDRPKYGINNLPLPIIRSDFSISLRQLNASRNGNTPLDTTMAEAQARRVAEEAEKLALGTSTLWPSTESYGGGYIYGLTTEPNVNTVTLTAPTASGWTGSDLLDDVLEMRQAAYDDNHFGPFALYFSPGWDRYLGADFKTNSDKSVITRLKEIDGINTIRTLDYLSNYKALLIEMSSDVVREVVGLDFTTVQWEEQGGMLLNFAVMAILVPQVRSDQSDQSGIVYGSN